MLESTALLEVWRAEGKGGRFEEVLERISGLVRSALNAETLLVKRIDAERSLLETVGVSSLRSNATPLGPRRQDCPPQVLQELLTWAHQGGSGPGRPSSRDARCAVLLPSGLDVHWAAVPLATDEGVVAALIAVVARGHVHSSEMEASLAQIAEPVAAALSRHLRQQELERLREASEADRRALLSRLQRHDVSDSIVGAETGLRTVMARVEQVAPTDAPVLVIGETGTGKEVVARAVHTRSPRARSPIVRVNCGAIPPGLIDSELFGHERGSFTGAVSTRQGWFERADGGTLFLDEVGELPLEAQVRLLRVLQDGTFERVGGQRSLAVDVRIVAATHRDLREMVALGTFREDLWYRISVFPISLPPLRERVEDIPLLAAHYAKIAGLRLRGKVLVPTGQDVELLSAYEWPGNIRELAAVIDRAAILGDGFELRVAAALGVAQSPVGRVAAGPVGLASAEAQGHGETLDASMRRHVETVLDATGGRVGGRRGAAALLAVNPHTLWARVRKMGVDPRAHRGATSPGATTTAVASALATWDDAMRGFIERALHASGGRVEGPGGAARRLAINPHTLRARMRRLGLVRASRAV